MAGPTGRVQASLALAAVVLAVPVSGGLIHVGARTAEPPQASRPAVVDVPAPAVIPLSDDPRPARRVLSARSARPAHPAVPVVVEVRPVPEPEPPPSPEPTTTAPATVAESAPPASAVPPVTAAAPTRTERCQRAIAASGLAPAADFTIQCGPSWNSGSDGWTDYYCADLDTPSTCTGTISIHPDDHDSDAHWVDVVEHEIGHSWCIRDRGDFGEACARAYE